jgi:ATP-dependent Lhr-like helicase
LNDLRRGFPPGRNVGTQLRARRLKQARARSAARELAQAAEAAALPPTQLSLPSAEGWFAARGWTPQPFQREVWNHIAHGRSGLLYATTGSGKTYAMWFGLLEQALRGTAGLAEGPGLRLLWITPMRALAADTVRSLQGPLQELGLPWTIGLRTGDTDAATRARHDQGWPQVLVTTPESLTLLLARRDCRELLCRLYMVVVDEWHELIASKRGVQVQLALARLARFAAERGARPITWGLSATIGNLDHARDVLLGADAGEAAVVHAGCDKPLLIDTLLPQQVMAGCGRFPWGGHLGLPMVDPVVAEIEASSSTLVFTNTRSQAEIWYQALLAARPRWAGLIALHHGSLDREVRDWVEDGLKHGRLKAVVATSSLDLGVDFLPVARVLQIGSPKSVARLLQRAGRSGHAPGRTSRAPVVPTHALEVLEALAARKAAEARRLEARTAPVKPLDVLVQHLVTIAVGTGFDEAGLLQEVRGAWSFRGLTAEDWAWALDFAGRGGDSLHAYPQYHRIALGADGRFTVPDAQVARRHRISIGTITAESSISVRERTGSGTGGRGLGAIEESFIARLRPGDAFVFAGRVLELIEVREMTAWVRKAARRSGAVPRWAGTRLPFSGELGEALIEQLELARDGRYDSPELQAVRPLLQLQQRVSNLPGRQGLLVESLRSEEGHHLFVYPLAGRAVHAGLAALIAYRAGQVQPASVSIAINDYGFELLSAQPIAWRSLWREAARTVLAADNLLADVLASLNAGGLAQRRFREIARVAGLVFVGYPGQGKSARQLQASSGLLYEVLRRFDAGNRLLAQAEREVLEQELELDRLARTLQWMRTRTILFNAPSRATPFAFPLMVERLREQLSTETLQQRVRRMVAELEAAAGPA